MLGDAAHYPLRLLRHCHVTPAAEVNAIEFDTWGLVAADNKTLRFPGFPPTAFLSMEVGRARQACGWGRRASEQICYACTHPAASC